MFEKFIWLFTDESYNDEIEVIRTGSKTIVTSMSIDFKAKIYVDDVKNEIDDHMRGMKSYFDNKFMDMERSHSFYHYNHDDSTK